MAERMWPRDTAPAGSATVIATLPTASAAFQGVRAYVPGTPGAEYVCMQATGGTWAWVKQYDGDKAHYAASSEAE